jgi:hypothetical protein
MDRKYIDDHHIVARYLAEQLPEEDRTAFEAYCLQHPDVVREMEAVARVKVGLMGLRSRGALDAALRPQPRYWRRSYLAVAAGIVLAIGVLRITARLPEVQPVLSRDSTALQTLWGRPVPVANTYVLLRTRRGTRYDVEITEPARSEVIELRVLPEYLAISSRYRVTLSLLTEDSVARKIGEMAGLQPEADGYVTIFVNGARIEPGRYELLLSADTAGGTDVPRSRFVIRVR